MAIESNGTTTYVCDGTDGQNGSDGASLTWSSISADATAEASHGYIVTAASAVTLTLPSSAGLSLGDDVRLIVQGAADVNVAPNGAQTFDFDRGKLGWRPVATPGVEWSQIVMSGDGRSFVGLSGNAGAFRSGDSGASWSRLAGMTAQNPQTVVTSGDGSVIAVGTWGNGFWYSTDSGTTWAEASNGPQYPVALAMSADGTTLFEVEDANNWPLKVSMDSGADWTTVGNAPGQYLTSLACAADCSTVYAVDEYGDVYAYQASTWAPLTTGIGESNGKVASSDDGMTVVVTATSGQIVYSHDAGATWKSASVPARPWYPVAVSSDGMTMIAGAYSYGESGAVVMSKDSGATWTVVDATPQPWGAVAITSDGAHPFAVANDGGIFGQGNGSVLATHSSELDFTYEGDNAFLITSDAGTAYGPY